jgi:hypothetical protein
MNIFDRLKASEIPFRVNTFVDGLYDVEIGDPLNGIKARSWQTSMEDVAEWLVEAARTYFGDSEFVKGLSDCSNDRIPLDVTGVRL